MRGKLGGLGQLQIPRFARDDNPEREGSELRAESAFSKSVFMKSEDEASQLNRLGETRQAASLLRSVFVGASRQYCVFSCVQVLTLLRRPSAFEQVRTES